MTRVIGAMEEKLVLKEISTPFSPQRQSKCDDQAPMTGSSLRNGGASRRLVGNAVWLSKKMVDGGCSLAQTLQVMKDQCRGCSIVSPISCVEQCDVWKVKREFRETETAISNANHEIKLLNALKNERRLAILSTLWRRRISLKGLQMQLRSQGFYHSQKTINEYVNPLVEAGLVKKHDRHFHLTLYGRKIKEALTKHGFTAQLPAHSSGNEEKILKSLLAGSKTRSELTKIIPHRNLSRTLKRLQEHDAISNNAHSSRIFYFRTKRPLNLERLSPTQKRICEAIPQAGISASELSKIADINLRRTYKYLRSLRGKKLLFRREVPNRYELTAKGKKTAEFLKEVQNIRINAPGGTFHTMSEN